MPRTASLWCVIDAIRSFISRRAAPQTDCLISCSNRREYFLLVTICIFTFQSQAVSHIQVQKHTHDGAIIIFSINFGRRSVTVFAIRSQTEWVLENGCSSKKNASNVSFSPAQNVDGFKFDTGVCACVCVIGVWYDRFVLSFTRATRNSFLGQPRVEWRADKLCVILSARRKQFITL